MSQKLHPMTKRVIQAEAEIEEVFAALFEDLRDSGYATQEVSLALNVKEIRRKGYPLSWRINFDMELGTVPEG